VIPWLRSDSSFPPITTALHEPNGLLAAGGDLSVERLLAAYERGIFPWYSEGQPILWWSPDPRMVLYVDEFRVARSLRKTVARKRFEIRIDADFPAVIRGCAAPRDTHGGTWITSPMLRAYLRLHEQGFAHSVEAWRDGHLAGGLYGVTIGRMFFGESMFAREPDASKIALVHLVARLQQAGCPLIDCQQETAHLARFGARPVPRAQFADEIGRLVHSSSPAKMWDASVIPETDTP
jgi:leucyl/phenylalanyl-tRNA---protein transferase